MADPERPLLAELRDEIRLLAVELRECVALRWRLATLEFQSDARLAKRLAIGLAVAAVMMLTALPILLVAAADLLAGCLGLARWAWLAGFGLALVLAAAMVAGLAWRRFRRYFTGMEETLAELREDAIWLRDWANGESPKEESRSP